MIQDCYTKFIEQSCGAINAYMSSIDLDYAQWSELVGWDAIIVPNSVIEKEYVLNIVSSKFPITQAGILRMEPMQCYHWHTDAFRGATINLLLTPESKSYTLFGESKNDDNMLFTELQYEANTFYLFDTQTPHTIINFEEPRYLLSLQFDTNYSYSEVKSWCVKNNLMEAWPSG